MNVRRLLPLSGIVFVVIIALGIIVISDSTPDTDASAADVASYYGSHEIREAVSAFVLAATTPFLIMFAARLATAGWAAGRSRVWPLMLVGGSILTAAIFLVGAAVHFALVDGADNGVSADALQALNLIDGSTWVAFNAGLGVMMLGAAGSLIPLARTYRWLGWVALVLGIALFIIFADFIALLLTGIWIIITSVVLFRDRDLEEVQAAPL